MNIKTNTGKEEGWISENAFLFFLFIFCIRHIQSWAIINEKKPEYFLRLLNTRKHKNYFATENLTD